MSYDGADAPFPVRDTPTNGHLTRFGVLPPFGLMCDGCWLVHQRRRRRWPWRFHRRFLGEFLCSIKKTRLIVKLIAFRRFDWEGRSNCRSNLRGWWKNWNNRFPRRGGRERGRNFSGFDAPDVQLRSLHVAAPTIVVCRYKPGHPTVTCFLNLLRFNHGALKQLGGLPGTVSSAALGIVGHMQRFGVHF